MLDETILEKRLVTLEQAVKEIQEKLETVTVSPNWLEKLTGSISYAVLSCTEKNADVLQQVAEVIEQIPNRRQQSNIAASTAILAGLVLDIELIKRVLRRDIMG